MAASSLAPLLTFLFSLIPFTLKLDQNNFAFWSYQVLATIRTYDLEDFLFGTRSQPEQFIALSVGEGSIVFDSSFL